MVPQWDLLTFLVHVARRRYRTFRLMMQAEVAELIEQDGRVAGVRVETPDGMQDIYAHLVIGADGRGSIVRRLARLGVEDIGAPIDALWMRVSKRPSDSTVAAFGNIRAGRVFVMFDRGDYWQCAYVIPKGGFDELKRAGLDVFRAGIVEVVPWLDDRIGELASWNDVKLLTVKIDRLMQWHRPGVLCIGDAAHAMSPIGGVGINLAIQDAVAAANILWKPLQRGAPSAADLQAVQDRRVLPTRLTQAVQVFVQNRVLSPALGKKGGIGTSLLISMLRAFPSLKRIPARIVGLGIRPEHIRSPEL
jgi:2-polyprenyl-6-methoxyphenol hydroxylase-like FAD-dependent oxidoreductase